MAETNGPSLIVLKVKSLREIENRVISKSESGCHMCGCPFSKKGASQSTKHVCRFCYHAVCSACSPLSAVHPESNDSERICLTCYTHYLRIHIEEEDAPKLEILIECELKKHKQHSLEKYEGELEKIKEEHRKRELAMHEQVDRLNGEVEEKDERIRTLDFSAEKNDGDKSKTKESIQKFANEIKDLQLQNQDLKKQIESVKENQRKLVTPVQKGGCLKSCVVF